MAMTKKEQAAMQAAIDKADHLAALRFSSPIPYDVPIPSDGYSEGWFFNSYSFRVWQGWSTSTSHGDGPAPTNGQRHYNGSQGPRRMYSTEVLALMAMRYEMANLYAAELMKVDRRIAALTGGQ